MAVSTGELTVQYEQDSAGYKASAYKDARVSAELVKNLNKISSSHILHTEEEQTRVPVCIQIEIKYK